MSNLRLWKRKYGRYQVFGHVSSGHCYKYRLKNDRRNIPEDERHIEIKELCRPENISNHLSQNISYGSIELEMIGWRYGSVKMPTPRYLLINLLESHVIIQ